MKEKLINRKPIRQVHFDGLLIGGEKEFNYTRGVKPLFVLNLPIYNFADAFAVTKEYYNGLSLKEIIKKADSSQCDILALTFNIENFEQIKYACELLKDFLPLISKPLMLKGCGVDDVDSVLIPKLLECIDREVIVATLNENNYKEIIPSVLKGGHVVSIRTPIDINLAKEMNILVSDMGQPLDKILIDADIGGLGYGLDYGYSIMEKIKLEGFWGDEYLNMPLISFVAEESLKTKEAKYNGFSKSFGKLSERTLMIELASVSAAVAAGANVLVVNNPQVVEYMKGLG